MNDVTLRSDNVGEDEMAAADDELDAMISIRVSKKDVTAMRRLSERLPIKPITIARIALRIGLDTLADDPARMFDVMTSERPTKRRSKPKRKRGT